MWKCPECGEQIESLRYNVITQGYEYGNALLEEYPSQEMKDGSNRNNIIDSYDDSDYGDTDWSGDVNYECPECECELQKSELIWEEEEEEEEEEEIKKEGMTTNKKGEKVPKDFEETEYEITRPSCKISERNIERINDSSLICKECKHIIVYSIEESFSDNTRLIACPKCNTENSKEEYDKLLESGFFDKKQKIIKKKYVKNKKIKNKKGKTLGK